MTGSQGCALPEACLVDRRQPVTFTYEDRTIPAFQGQSIAAALYAAGLRIFTRSFKYHRPRGLFCVSGDCPNCLMHVDGRPNVRTCIEPVRDGQVVQHQNAWPSLNWDVLNLFDKLHRFLPVGFYYKRFYKPRWMWPLFEHVVRHVAGLGRIDPKTAPQWHTEIEHLHTEVCVIGGGPAGVQAAFAAGSAGAQVLLLEKLPRLGGHLLYSRTGMEDGSPTEADLRSLSRVRVLCATAAFGLYESNLIAAYTGNRLLKIRAKQIIVCTGGRQQPFPFHNNDLPGVFLGDGILRLASLYGVLAGSRAVVLTDNEDGYVCAAQLSKLGVSVAAVVDHRPLDQGSAESTWQRYASSTVVSALGRRRLKGVCVAGFDERTGMREGSQQTLTCDLLCMVSRRQPANELLLQGGMRFGWRAGQWLPEREVPGLRVAGAAAGITDGRMQMVHGSMAGLEAAAELGHIVSKPEAYRQQWQECQTLPPPRVSDSSLPQWPQDIGKAFVCLCEDVTEEDIRQAMAEGFDHIETLKRYTTANMGPCQGKMCGAAVAELCARVRDCDIATVGMTTSRPPAVPVELSVLAAGHKYQPIRRTPLHYWHEAAGARWLDAGQWKRPESYGDPVAEVQAVRSGVGLIDISTLGKIEVTGRDAGELLERVYLNGWSDLPVGRIRYGAMCNEDGILIDDGIGTRLDANRFYLSATTGNADAIVQWLELWKTAWRLNVAIIAQTSAYAAMNLAGPRAREVLERVTELEVSPSAFPYMAMREGKVAGVPCRLLRIGFVGELGYEMHCPSSHAWHLWMALWEAGRPFGLKAFGVEAQRILRLEKGHLIIGQDTDALSHPLEAGLEWMVRFDKPRFIGREPLSRLKAMGPRSRLVGFHLLDGDRVPPEGSQVVEEGRPVGRLTSTRFSPTLKRSLGLAWVPQKFSGAGQRFWIRWNGADVPAVVVPTPFYDPEGKRLKS